MLLPSNFLVQNVAAKWLQTSIQNPLTDMHWTTMNCIIHTRLILISVWVYLNEMSVPIRNICIQLCNFCSQLTVESYIEYSFSVIINNWNRMTFFISGKMFDPFVLCILVDNPCISFGKFQFPLSVYLWVGFYYVLSSEDYFHLHSFKRIL